ncbi:MAG: magnesium-translocating P-type ATPase [Candidatus Heimdallarchaeota archaeon]|nr:magnesium-translocating P-type ATPase [Candidatus Heimdallarchaeota archaeon]
MAQLINPWAKDSSDLIDLLESDLYGLTQEESNKRLTQYGLNLLSPKKKLNTVSALLSQFKSPIIFLLLSAAFLAFITGDQIDGIIISAIILFSSLLGFWQERMATNAIEKLMSRIHTHAKVLRKGNPVLIPLEQIVPGDIILLSAGNIVPADLRLLETNQLFTNEATLTGETFPIEKSPSILNEDSSLSKRTNMVYMGTYIVSGTGKGLVIKTGQETELGMISARLGTKTPTPEFERGIKQFGLVLMEIVLLITITIFGINVYLNRPVLDSFLFALALAVGLTPQLLPAIIMVNLSRGAKKMADKKVIVKKLTSIENFGSMNVLCSDKTGTLTQGIMTIHSTVDIEMHTQVKILDYAYLNAYYQTGFQNPIDDTICASHTVNAPEFRKLDELPYDFIRKRISVLFSTPGMNIIIAKGAVTNLLEICNYIEKSDGAVLEIDIYTEKIHSLLSEFSTQGLRCIGIAYKNVDTLTKMSRADEAEFVFLGFLLLMDPSKPEVPAVIQELKSLGITLRIITGDNQHIAKTVAENVGIIHPQIITGNQIRKLSDEALIIQANQTDVFAEIEPNQKEQIILALRKSGNVVGYMGDGINDASALHAADVGISVDSAVDVAKEASEIILLEKNLEVLLNGINEGRKTFANSLKYVLITISANFGNMFSMAIASLFLPFLPLLPTQILLINFMTDFPSMTIATDDVDLEMIKTPKRWNIRDITEFMITFGLMSTIFDVLTFIVLISVLHAQEAEFQTGWFLVSVVSELLILLVIRTRKIFYKSKPSNNLLISTIIVILATLIVPFTPLISLFGFSPIPPMFLVILAVIISLYILTTELGKRIIYSHIKFFS